MIEENLVDINKQTRGENQMDNNIECRDPCKSYPKKSVHLTGPLLVPKTRRQSQISLHSRLNKEAFSFEMHRKVLTLLLNFYVI